MNKLYIGIDNGVSGSIGIIGKDNIQFVETPTKTCLKYTKKKANITRIVYTELEELLIKATEGYATENIIVGLERPMVNPTRFNARYH